MSRRLRKLVGGTAMLAFVTFYAMIAMALAQARPVQEANGLLQTLIFAILGMAWVLPMMPLIRWMEGDGR